MSEISFKGERVITYGDLPAIGEKAPHFDLIKTNLSKAKLEDFKGKRVILNIFPSIDTGVCATSVRNFNERATELDNTVVLCISRDLPFAQKRFVNDEGLKNVINLSDFKEREFGKDYGVEMITGPLEGLLSRVVIVLDENLNVIHAQQVPDIAEEPNYLAALKTLL
ncbi:thiol peroxidase (atypical 2-Cys peroxiredoxin) [Zunongwangia mangrovi]|uniref:Thiol peroxidase n=1 Tax=Zunongwangia mangrovi TaxID=1334022 RepID=A0A1I1I0V5_9FLAO|nr:thiol peroxidase [Zunongwangia mangrovi]SFC29442.1 thiol peroxidase (atypical 2-Cys peroxiredoxin) [Zunongwangia mangrovi]|tara:strand:- start:165 stop:665 length:501 start_codon:yes stop_codon:yes gene_type:complete